jgi:hypothetical protein
MTAAASAGHIWARLVVNQVTGSFDGDTIKGTF